MTKLISFNSKFIFILYLCNINSLLQRYFFFLKNGRCKSSNSHICLITNELLKIWQKKLQFESNSIPYTAKYLLSDKNNLQNANSLIFKVFGRLINVKWGWFFIQPPLLFEFNISFILFIFDLFMVYQFCILCYCYYFLCIWYSWIYYILPIVIEFYD